MVEPLLVPAAAGAAAVPDSLAIARERLASAASRDSKLGRTTFADPMRSTSCTYSNVGQGSSKLGQCALLQRGYKGMGMQGGSQHACIVA